MNEFGIIGDCGLGWDRGAISPKLSFPQIFFEDPILLRENRLDGRGLAIVSISKSTLTPHQEKFLKVLAAAPQLFKACKAALELLESEMSEADNLDHAFHGHEKEDCALCLLREAVARVEE